MAETLMPTVVFIGTFMMVAALLVAGLSQVVALNRVAQNPGDYEDLIGGELFLNIRFEADPDEDITDNVIENYTNTGWSMDDLFDMQTTYSAPEPYDNRDVACFVMRNATEFPANWYSMKIEEPGVSDYVLFYQSKRVWGGFFRSYSHMYVTPNMVADYIKPGFNYSDVPMKLWDWFTIRFYVDEGTDITNAVEDWNYSIALGLSYNCSITNASPWAMVGQFLTFQLPDLGFYMNLILAIPFWFAIAFLALTIISRFFPGIPGG